MRGTPVNDPFTDFEYPIFSNDRGGVIDLLANGRQRGFNLKFKWGNHETAGRRGTLPDIARHQFL